MQRADTPPPQFVLTACISCIVIAQSKAIREPESARKLGIASIVLSVVGIVVGIILFIVLIILLVAGVIAAGAAVIEVSDLSL